MKFHIQALSVVLFLGSACQAFTAIPSGKPTSTISGSSFTSLHVKRRDVLGGSAIGAAAMLGATNARASDMNMKMGMRSSSASVSGGTPIADLPMIRLRLPQNGLGREYVAIKIKIDDKPYEFMVDSGLTTELITPHLQKELRLRSGRSPLRGLTAAGSPEGQSMVTLSKAKLCCGEFPGRDAEELSLPELRAVITDFPQHHVDPEHDVEGMIGMELLSLFDVDFDFDAQRLRFWPAGSADTGVIRETLVEIPAVVINETGLIGIRVASADKKQKSSQPVLGFLDCGASFTCMNWKAAELLGLPTNPKDPTYSKGPKIAAIGVDGKRIDLPTVRHQLSFAGDVQIDPRTGKPVGFAPPPENFEPWEPVQLAVGDLPVFRSVLGDGVTPYEGPAVLIGLDILSQRRIILETGAANTRRRKVLVAPKNSS